MKYPLFGELPALAQARMVTARRHPRLPLAIYNYTAQAQHAPMAQWTTALMDCRGLILDDDGKIVGRPFRNRRVALGDDVRRQRSFIGSIRLESGRRANWDFNTRGD